VLFVTNAERLQPEAHESLKLLCNGILIRRNIGYDFGALREGIEHFQLPRDNTEMLILANDSVYGPFTPLDDILGRVNFDVADLWGVTDSWQHRYHLQSFFLVAGRRAMRDPAWAGFWSLVRPVASKIWVIRRYEVGFTQRMLRAGLRCNAIWSYSSVIRSAESEFLNSSKPKDAVQQPDQSTTRRTTQILDIRSSYEARMPLNPTSDLWKTLLRLGFPFIKRELLRDNPGKLADLVDWSYEVSLIDPAHIDIIESDLKRTLLHTSP
jgi:lipopolysaccharide biosynthesis protein